MHLSRFGVGLTVFSLLTVPLVFGDWPQWRGPKRDGESAAVTLPRQWPPQLRRLFSVEVGEGHAAPVVVGDRVVVFARVGEQEVVRAIHARTGEEVWKDSYEAPYTMDPAATAHGKGPKATPTIHDGRVYTHGMSCVFTCYDLQSGKVLWRHDFIKQYQATGPQYGTAASPLIEGNLVLTVIGDAKQGQVLALDRKSGEIRWRTPCDGPAYGSPVAADLAGTRQIVTLTRNTLCGLEPTRGRLLWQTRYHTAYEQNCLTPIVMGDRILISGYMRPTAAYRVTRSGSRFDVTEEWRSDRLKMYMSSPVLHREHLYGLDQTGKFVCLDAKTGQVRWSGGAFGEYASIIRVQDDLLVCDEGGEMAVIAADPGSYQEKARLRLSDQPVWAHLAVVPGVLYVKDRTRLLAYELPR
jgi:outer membrane protein assembly factor BamB